MKSLLSFFFITPLVISSLSYAHNLDELKSTAQDSTQFLQSLTSFGDQTIPSSLLAKTQCIATLPGVIRAGVIFGGEYGRGLVSCRIPQGGWSSPIFISITGGSWGLQLGAKSTDMVLLFMRSDSAERFTENEIRLSGDLTLTAGPIGKNAREGVDYQNNSAVFSYSRSAGLFGGLTIDGGVLKANHEDDVAIYGPNANSRSLLTSRAAGVPEMVAPYMDAVMAIAP